MFKLYLRFYDLKKLFFTYLKDSSFISTYVPARCKLSDFNFKILRQFQIINLEEPNQKSVESIYQEIIIGFLGYSQNDLKIKILGN